MTTAIPLRAVVMIGFVIVTQVAGASMLVKTAGFRDIGWTAACLATYALSLFVFARVLHEGLALSLAMPVLAALVPLATIAVAVTLLGEPVSWPKLGILGLACVLVGLAAAVS